MDKIFKALGSKERLVIMDNICKSKQISCLDLLRKTKMSQSTLSHHLKILNYSELVTMRKAGKYHIFSLNNKVWEKVGKYVDKVIQS